MTKYGQYWTPLGVMRFSKTGYRGNAGYYDGARDGRSGEAVTFGPEWRRGDGWVALAEMAEHYRGVMTTEVVSSVSVKARMLYAPVTGVGGPAFYMDFSVTPDACQVALSSPHGVVFGLTLPVLDDNGQPFAVDVGKDLVQVRYHTESVDVLTYRVMNRSANLVPTDRRVRSSYGWLRGVRAESIDGRTVQVEVTMGSDRPK